LHPIIGGHLNKAVNLCRDRQQRAQHAFVALAFQFQRKAIAGVGDKRKRVRGIYRQWR